MSTKKERHIPIKVSRVFRFLEGTGAAKKSGDKVILSAKENDSEKKVDQQERIFSRARMEIEPLGNAQDHAPSYAINTTPTREETQSTIHHARVRAHRHTHEHDHLRKENVERERRVAITHSHRGVTDTISAVPVKPSILEGIDISRLRVAYFCMEIGVDPSLPFYSGGLGVLAGDTIKSCADLDVPIIGVSLLYRKGFFRQRLDASGWQVEDEEYFDPSHFMKLLPERVTLSLGGRSVVLRAWMYLVCGIGDHVGPVIFLDTDCDENAEVDRKITQQLYAGDTTHRLLQEAVLGIGGVRMLEAIGAVRIEKYHMNEGHASFLTVELYKRFIGADDPIQLTHHYAVFTTHTPVAAGHDRFPLALVEGILGKHYIPESIKAKVVEGGDLNMTRLGLELAGHINGVAKKHGDVTREMFPGYKIDSITNGVYAREWVGEHMKRLFQKYLPGWETDPYSLRYALSLPHDELWEAHMAAKRELFKKVQDWTGTEFHEDVFTIGFARRATSYKRAELIFSDVERLKRIAAASGKGIQIILSGKAHPHDHDGKLIIQRIIRQFGDLGPHVRACYVPNYDLNIARALVSGVDLWLNTPRRPQEASGTSGMKAALNGVPHFSVLDGWWLEGHIENITGWAIGPHPEHEHAVPDREDTESFYTKLEYVILPKYYSEREAWTKIMRHTIAINGSFFNTHRMVEQYVLSTYFR